MCLWSSQLSFQQAASLGSDILSSCGLLGQLELISTNLGFLWLPLTEFPKPYSASTFPVRVLSPHSPTLVVFSTNHRSGPNVPCWDHSVFTEPGVSFAMLDCKRDDRSTLGEACCGVVGPSFFIDILDISSGL